MDRRFRRLAGLRHRGRPGHRGLGGRVPTSLQIAWNMPGGSLTFGLDGLSAFFCLPILLVSPLAALYGCQYLAHEKKPLGPASFFYNVLTASMLLLLAARNGLLFLVIWEVMAISSFFLVVFDDEHAHVRQAGWTYLVAAHIGTGALLVLFALFGKQANSLDFDLMAKAALSPTMAGILFVLAVIGFGTKAGFIPLHVWLPEAHPAAPSHVSALMSGVMIKTGIYGLLRILTLLGHPSAAWGWTLVIIGLVSGILGVAFALAQHDLKRLLAYHSVENIGIIALGIGAGLLGLAWNQPALAVLGFGGGILHVLNHAVFKSLLFLGAGAVVHSTGTRDIDHLGGLIKSMRWTAVTFRDRLGGHLRIAPVQRIHQRVPHLRRRLQRRAGRGAGDGHSGHRDRRRPGADRGPGGRVLRQGVRRRVPRRAAQLSCDACRGSRRRDALAHGGARRRLPRHRPAGAGGGEDGSACRPASFVVCP